MDWHSINIWSLGWFNITYTKQSKGYDKHLQKWNVLYSLTEKVDVINDSEIDSKYLDDFAQ